MFVEDALFNIFPILFGVAFVAVFGFILFNLFSNVKQGMKNNNSPLLKVPAEIVSKRMQVRGDHSHTTYFVTFEVESGDRMELKVNGSEYGMLVEEDTGLLSFQGTRYVSFERKR